MTAPGKATTTVRPSSTRSSHPRSARSEPSGTAWRTRDPRARRAGLERRAVLLQRCARPGRRHASRVQEERPGEAARILHARHPRRRCRPERREAAAGGLCHHHGGLSRGAAEAGHQGSRRRRRHPVPHRLDQPVGHQSPGTPRRREGEERRATGQRLDRGQRRRAGTAPRGVRLPGHQKIAMVGSDTWALEPAFPAGWSPSPARPCTAT